MLICRSGSVVVAEVGKESSHGVPVLCGEKKGVEVANESRRSAVEGEIMLESSRLLSNGSGSSKMESEYDFRSRSGGVWPLWWGRSKGWLKVMGKSRLGGL